MHDLWQSGDPYEYYMGRWSRLVADKFLKWLAFPAKKRWLDVGCGTGALSEAIIRLQNPRTLTAIDQSAGFVQSVQNSLGNKVICKEGNALSIPVENDSVDIVVSGLLLNFIAEPEKALTDMRRVTVEDGTVAAYIWDYAGSMEFLRVFWDCAVELDDSATQFHESLRFPNANESGLRTLFENCDFSGIETATLDIQTNFSNFDDYWRPFLGGQGPAPTYVSKLSNIQKDNLRDAIQTKLPIKDNGSISLMARAWGIRGKL